MRPAGRARVIALALVPLFVTAARADDIGSTMAALKDTKAECRYLAELCGDLRASSDILAQKIEVARGATATAKASIAGANRITPEAAAARRDAQNAITLMNAAETLNRQKLMDLTAAAKVLKAKREKMPACVNECVDSKGEKVLQPW